MKKIIIPIGALLMAHSVHAQLTQGENYVYSKSYLDYNTSGQPTKTSETVQYMDGLGRPKQVVNVKASPLGRDVVTHIEYDGFGRQIYDFLPVPQAGTQNGGIVPMSLANATQPDIYGSEKIFSEKVLENSPLDRILEQKQAGNDWSNKPVKFGYNAVTVADRVRKFTTVTTWENGATKSRLEENWLYTDGQLYKNSVKDEDGNETIEFKNGQGQTVLVRKVIGVDEYADTDYVYNEFNQLAFVIPPLASIRGDIVPNTVKQDELCYQYRYDGRGRLVEKKLPGKGWEFMVYDKADRLLLTQDAVMAPQNKWLMTKYDMLGRVAYTGIMNNSSSRSTLQNQIADLVIYDARHPTGIFRNGITLYYTNVYFSVDTLLSVNYYDSYPQGYGFNPPFPSTIQGEPVLTEIPSSHGRSTKGLPVMSMVKNIEDDNWTKNYSYYDTKGRPVSTYSINHLGGYTKTESKLDFAGVAQTVITKHKRLSTDTEKVITENFTYDHQNRMLVHKHQVDGNPEEILAQNKYNELSQLENKKVGGISIGSPLQSIDYKYNIRGWMTQINDPATLNGKLFGYKVKYTDPVYNSISPGKFNGNIAEIDWTTSNDDKLRRYNYKYDRLDRLKNGIYSEPNSTVPQNNYYNEILDYDINGNILNLQRNRFVENATGAQLMDNLNYIYTGNRLNTVNDASGNYGGYPDTSGNLITYDDNGNMKNHVDKGILQIDYNYLNLPTYLKFDKEYYSRDNWDLSYNENTKYIYKADGIKLKKIHTFGSGRTSIETTKTTDYLDGFQYTDNVMQFLPTSEGYYDFVQNKYIYQYEDQVGNVRLAYYKGTSGTAQIDRTTNYYPFGLEFGGELNIHSSISPNYTYSTQGQEKQQDTGWSSFKWRNYDPAMGRFFNVDPLSEKYAYQSHYNFSENKVVSHRELEGLEAIDANKVREAFETGKKGKSYQLIIHVDQPGKGGDRDTYQTRPIDSGHAFLTLVRKNTDGSANSKTFGFYPYPQSVNPLASEADGKIKDNSGHEKEVVQTRGITEKNFNDILDFVESDKNTKYDLNTNNCTDFVINAAAAAGIKLPKTKGTWPNGGGLNPGDLGQDLRKQNERLRDGKSPDPNTNKSKNKNDENNDNKIGF